MPLAHQPQRSMQSHIHATRTMPPHMRAHNITLHPVATNAPPHLTQAPHPVGGTPPPPPPQHMSPTNNQGQHHAASPVGAPIPTHHTNRIGGHQQMPLPQKQMRTLYATNRPTYQHQHLNNNNNNNNNYNNKNSNKHINHHHLQQHQQQLQPEYTHHHQPHHMVNTKNHAPRSLSLPATTNVVLTNANGTTAQYYNHSSNVSGNKANNGNSNHKTILQNPNRHMGKPATIIKTTKSTTAASHSVQGGDVGEYKENPSQSSDSAATSSSTPIVSIHAATEVQQQSLELIQEAHDDEANKDTNGESNKENHQPHHRHPPDDSSRNGDKNEEVKQYKEKTPMCLVNELARFNKIQHQYRLTGERGPAHCKRFTVTLKLGEEEYTAEGFKIKRAQHMAAAEAIEKTKYKHPIPKAPRRGNDENGPGRNLTPTVELNALAMKLGQQTYYLYDPRQIPPSMVLGNSGGSEGLLPPQGAYGLAPPLAPPPHIGPPHMSLVPPPHPRGLLSLRRNGGYHQHHGQPPQRGQMKPRYGLYPGSGQPSQAGMPPPMPPYPSLYGMPNTPCKITLIVGKQKFVGIGRTLQQAKHDAAAQALQVLKTQALEQQQNEEHDSGSEEGDKKSPVSQVHEIAIKRSMAVHFKVLREEGPAHMKNFITACIVGSIVTEGEGNGKKISKKRAAEKMLEELKKLPPTPVKTLSKGTKSNRAFAVGNPSSTPKAKGGAGVAERKKRGSSIKEKTEEDNESESPITKLIQLQQSRKEKEPVFEWIGRNGPESSRRREFIMEVRAGEMVARGVGVSKKLAKRNAAQNILDLLTFGEEEKSKQLDSSMEGITKMDQTVSSEASETMLTMPIQDAGDDVPLVETPAGQVPGVLIMRQNKKNNKKKEKEKGNKSASVSLEGVSETSTEDNGTKKAEENEAPISPSSSLNTKASITSNDNGNGNANSSGGTGSSGNNTIKTAGVSMKEQLIYLSNLLGFEVAFSDYPKGNHKEFLSIVTLSTNPPQICHGVGISSEESQNDAAKSALKQLSDLGLSNIGK